MPHLSPIMKPLVGTPIQYDHPLSKGIVGHWLFNEGAGDRVYDLSGNQNNGVFVNEPKWVAGKFGRALEFDGNDDYVDVGSPSKALLVGRNLTIVVWVRRDSSIRGVILGAEKESGSHALYYIDLDASHYFRFWCESESDVDYTVSSATTYNNSDWHQVVATDDGSNLKIYIDGVFSNSQAASFTPPDAIDNFNIGFAQERGGNPNHFNGLIDNVSIYNRALSAEDVMQLYHEPFCIFVRRSTAYFVAPPVGPLVTTFIPTNLSTRMGMMR